MARATMPDFPEADAEPASADQRQREVAVRRLPQPEMNSRSERASRAPHQTYAKESWFYEPLRSSLVDAGLRVDYAILRPRLPVAINRAAERTSTRLADPDVIAQLSRGFTDLDAHMELNAVIDTSVQTPDDTVTVIQERLRSGKLTV